MSDVCFIDWNLVTFGVSERKGIIEEVFGDQSTRIGDTTTAQHS